MTSYRPDWLWQTLGLMAGVVPAIFAAYAFVVGIVLYAAVAGLLMLIPRIRPFAYGMLCSLLILPGITLGLL
ncbi:hypothetical protein [Mycolicibacterium palauense]|uniref:hypothetical protein n=1 Tax=Mycolicibacterium palauense TaxID=2034511 RepID=UPI000BFF1284|nr:hypothetical protein [Mycolicibacterium palauense]